RRRQEEEEDVSQRLREQERQHHEHRQPNELDPPRDLDRRPRAGHAVDRTAVSCGRTRAGAIATVRAMTTPRSRHAARLRASRRRAQARARWFVLAVAVTVLAVVTLAVTAFGNDRSSSSPLAGAPASAPVTSAPPEPQVLATVGNLRIQSPVAQGGVTAVGFHSSADGSLTLQPVGPQ